MNEATPPVKREYDSTSRQRQARAKRQAVLAAARHAFVTNGYASTTLAAVAAAAGVSVETIYKSFGSKPALAKAVFDVDVVGDDEPIPMLQRQFVQRNMAEQDPRRKLIDYGEHLSTVSPRIGPLLLVVRDAAAVDVGAAELWQQLQTERLTGMTAFAVHLAAEGHLRQDVTTSQAGDVLWTYNSVELWDLLVNQRHWTLPAYGLWIAEQLIAALLPSPLSRGRVRRTAAGPEVGR